MGEALGYQDLHNAKVPFPEYQTSRAPVPRLAYRER
jgi:hypothetical protein